MLREQGRDGDRYCKDGVGMGTNTAGMIGDGDKLRLLGAIEIHCNRAGAMGVIRISTVVMKLTYLFFTYG